MAARRRRTWIAIGGTTAAVAIGTLAAVALGAPTLSVPGTTRLPVNLTWSDGSATGFTLSRAPGLCSAPGAPVDVPLAVPTQISVADSPLDGHYCYVVTSTYADTTTAPSPGADVWVDNTPPTAPTVAFAPAPAGSALRGIVTVNASSSDPGGAGVATGVASYIISVDSAGALPTSQWNTAQVADGAHTLHVTAVDGAGNQSATTNVPVSVKNTAPGAPVVSPLQSPVAGSPTLTWVPVAGETYTITRSGSPPTDPVQPPWTDPATLAPGTYHYVVTARDAAGTTTTSADVAVVVIPPSVTAPRAISANSPTNTVPHLAWQPPVTFAVTAWKIFRDGSELTVLNDAAAGSFDDTGLTTQGPHVYSVQALSGAAAGDMSSAVSVTYDTVAPVLGAAAATANPNGSVSVTWPAADDPSPGSGIASYAVRRSATAAGSPSGGTAICTLTPPATGCVDSTGKNGTTYGYGVFAVDAAGNVAQRVTSARVSDTQPPDPVSGLRVISFDRTYARIGWTAAPKSGSADVEGYRMLKLRPGAKTALNPQDGTVVCREVNPQAGRCDAMNLTAGKKVTFAVYAYDDVPNYSAPVVISVVPHSVDHKPPHKPTKVRLLREGLRYTLKWVSPRDVDLAKFRVTLYDKGPAPRPSKGKAVVTGRVLHANFALTPGKRVYVNLFALDVSGNFSRVSKLIVAPGIVPKSKHKAAKQPPAKKKKPAKQQPAKKKPAKKAVPEKAVAISIEKT